MTYENDFNFVIIFVFAKLEISLIPTLSRTAQHSAEIYGKAFDLLNVTSSTARSPFGANQRGCSKPYDAPKTAP